MGERVTSLWVLILATVLVGTVTWSVTTLTARTEKLIDTAIETCESAGSAIGDIAELVLSGEQTAGADLYEPSPETIKDFITQ